MAIEGRNGDHRRVMRTLYRHDWSSPEEWAQSLDDLASFSEKDIARLFKLAVPRGVANENK